MRPPRHPALRWLWAVGGAPTAAAARLDVATPRLDELARDYGALPLLSDRLLDGVTRAIDLGAVLRATETLDGAAPAPDTSGARGAPPPKPAPARPRGPAATSVPRARVPRPRPTLDDQALAARAGAVEDAAALALHRRRSLAGDSNDGSARRSRVARPIGDAERREPVITAARAVATLRERVMRAGHAAAADTPVGEIPTPPAVAAMLAPDSANIERHQAAPSERDTARPLSAAPADAPSPAPLARALARAEATRARRATLPAAPTKGARMLPTLPATATDNGIAESFPDARALVAGGFRGLAARAANRDRGACPAAQLDAETTLSAVAVDRMTDAELAHRITRLLQREARRQGVALGMVEP